MDEHHVFCALNLPASATQPSIDSVQWSEDGQLFLTTKGAIYILTPDLGINYEDLSSTRSMADKHISSNGGDNNSNLRWYRNVVEFDRSEHHIWPLMSQEWGTLSLGSLHFSWRSVTLSPSSLSRNSGCFMVALNSNMEVSLWCATKNHLQEAWIKTQDITATLKAIPLPEELLNIPSDRQTYNFTLFVQVNCIQWSPQADFGLTPNPLADGSLLALGNRAGFVMLMRSDGNDSVQSIKSIRIADGWITHLAWGSWRISSVGECENHLACACSDGSITVLKVSQKYIPHAYISPTKSVSEIQVDFCILKPRASGNDKRGVSALKWVEAVNSIPTLLYAKPGTLSFFRLEQSEALNGRELCRLRLETPETSACSSSLAPVVGVTHMQGLDVLIVTLFDGSFHIVYDVSGSPALGEEVMDLDGGTVSGPSSEKISYAARQAFVKAETGSVQYTDANRTSGMTSFDGFGILCWLHEACRPNDFSYRHDAKRNSQIVTASLYDDQSMNEKVLELLRELLRDSRKVLNRSPIAILRSTLLHLSRKFIFQAVWQQIPNLLAFDSVDDTWDTPVQKLSTSTEEDRLRYRQSLRVHLYGWQTFLSCRLRLSIADFCWKLAPSENIRHQFGEVAARALDSITFRLLKVIANHALAMIEIATENDIRFIMRLVVQSLIEGTPGSLRSIGNDLHEALKRKFPSALENFNLEEPCPACNAPIPLDDLRNARCPAGHIWARCSITSFVLSTPMVRTCIGCTRKAFLAPSSRSSANPITMMWIPEVGRSWIVEELLEAARCCVYCGNAFVRLL